MNNENDNDNDNHYEYKLFKMFESCDTYHNGYLNEYGLSNLCRLLELRDNGFKLISSLTPHFSSSLGITFEQFREALLQFLGTENDTNTKPMVANEEEYLHNNDEYCVHNISDEFNIRSSSHNQDEQNDEGQNPPDPNNGHLKLNDDDEQNEDGDVDDVDDDDDDVDDEDGDEDDEENDIEHEDDDDEDHENDEEDDDEDDDEDEDDEDDDKDGDGEHNGIYQRANGSANPNPNGQSNHNNDDYLEIIDNDELIGNHSNSNSISNSNSNSLSDLQDIEDLHVNNGNSMENLYNLRHGQDHMFCCSPQSDMYIIEMESYYEKLLNDRLLMSKLSGKMIPVQEILNPPTASKTAAATTSASGSVSASAAAAAAATKPNMNKKMKEALPKRNTTIQIHDGGNHSSTSISSNNSSSSSSGEIKHSEMTFEFDVLTVKELIKIWDEAQIPDGKSMLSALGIEEDEISVKQLYKILDEELRNLEATAADSEANTNMSLALIALQAAELVFLRRTVRQFKDENMKLHSDNKDANRRAALLAAEIDECHNSIEDRAKKELQTLEQRHSLVLRELNAKMLNEREKYTQQTAELNVRIKRLEKERNNLADDIEVIQKENSELFAEIQKLQKQNQQVSKQNDLLKQELKCSEGKGTLGSEEGCEEDQITKEEVKNELMAKIYRLQQENASIRDKNDELIIDVENLSAELERLKLKSLRLRKSASSSNIEDILGLDALGEPFNIKDGPESTDSSQLLVSSKNLELELSSNEMTKKKNEGNEEEDEQEAKAKGNSGEQLGLMKPPLTLEKMEKRCKELEASLEEMKRAYEECEEYWANTLAEERQLNEELKAENDKKFTELMEKVREYEEQYKKDCRLSPILEKDCLEQQYIALEYENERYLSEIQMKEKEIDNLKNENSDLRLRLGESVEILTGACELNSEMIGKHLSESPAATPINYLWNQSTIQQPMLNYESAAATAAALIHTSPTTTLDEPKHSRSSGLAPFQSLATALSKHSKALSSSSLSLAGAAALPTGDNEAADCDSSSTASGKSFETHSVSSTHSNQPQPQPLPPQHSNLSQQSARNLFKDELKRLKYFELSLKDQINDLTVQRDGLIMELQQLHEAKPVLEKSYARTAHPSLLQRLNQSEGKVRHMETIMQQTWQQHQVEMNDLQGRIEQQKHLLADHSHRLQSADLIIKDLYVENAHLVSTIQRLEQQKSRENYLHQQQQQRPCINTLSGIP